MSDIEEDPAVIETINDSIEVDGTPTRDLQKVKKPRSEKQIEALKKAQVKRAENIEKRKAEKEVVKKLTKKEKLKQELKELEELEESVIVNEEDLDCNSVGKSNKLIEQNSKKKVVYESSSESESEEEYLEPEPAPAPLVRQKLRYGDVFRF